MAIEGQFIGKSYPNHVHIRAPTIYGKPGGDREFRQYLRDRAGMSGGWGAYEPPRKRTAEEEIAAARQHGRQRTPWDDPPVHPNCRARGSHTREQHFYDAGSGTHYTRPAFVFEREVTAGVDTKPGGTVWWFDELSGVDSKVWDSLGAKFNDLTDALLKSRDAQVKFNAVNVNDPRHTNQPMGRGNLFNMRKQQCPSMGKRKGRGRWDNG